MNTKKHIGSKFDDFLDDEGYLVEAEAIASKRVITHMLEQFKDEQRLSKTAMAKMLGTSRSELDRLLNPENTSVTLMTISRVAAALGKKITLKVQLR